MVIYYSLFYSYYIKICMDIYIHNTNYYNWSRGGLKHCGEANTTPTPICLSDRGYPHGSWRGVWIWGQDRENCHPLASNKCILLF